MIILDTNVISELMRPAASSTVEAWCNSQPEDNLFITTVTQAEILYGIRILSAGSRKKRLQEMTGILFDQTFGHRILSFDQESAEYYAEITAYRRSQGKPISQFDAQIAAICRAQRAAIATRNVDDFAGCGLEIINPWEA
ncbi:MAG: type II toxin-antitoxin system VapC family toxin [Leptolyngbya sp. SIO4C5]|nr:type II toxin-antitoxin system VapC family toxin [Leptolyngbya sp. SIO4C5]